MAAKDEKVSGDDEAKGSAPMAISHREIVCYRFRTLDLIYYLISVGLFLGDLATDSIIFVEYFVQGHLTWGCFAMSFTILPAGIIQLFSLRWYHADGSIKSIHWMLHFLFLGVLHRYLVLFYTTIHALRSKRFVKDKTWVYRQESDICMLHLFESFMGAAPQLILQLYIMAILHHAPFWTSMSAMVSFCSLTWAIGTYTKAMHKISPGSNDASWVALILQAFWRGGMLTSRIAVLVLTAVCIRKWFLLFLGLHWLFMTVWVILQNTDFCPTAWEERIYNCIIGLIYCFDFFNLRAGKTRYRLLVFYSIIVLQNLLSLIVYALYFRDSTKTDRLAIAISVIIGGMMIGLTSMLVYYSKFHSSRRSKKSASKSSTIVMDKSATQRSFKQYYSSSFASLPRSMDDSQRAASEEVTTDKQFLLTNIVHVSESPEDGIVNQSCKIENESKSATCEASRKNFEENSSLASQNSLNVLPKNLFPASNDMEYLNGQHECNESTEKEVIDRQKRRAICLPMTHGLDIDKLEKNVVANESEVICRLPSQKRRGICSSAQLILEIERDLEKKASADDQKLGSPDVDLKHSEYEEPNLDRLRAGLEAVKVVRDRLKTPTIFDGENLSENDKLSKDLQQRDETMSCVTSIHDYENVCPLGVARPPWCIRSWKGYTDIETYIHDDSVVRDRRRDTLTSTTTGTTYSSEFSDTTCVSSILRGILKQDDYLDTLAYDLIDSQESKSAYNEESNVSGKTTSNLEEQNATLYIAKPVVIDDKGGMFALDTILEEHDDTSTEEKHEYVQPSSCDSVSTLVSTIDQIRKYTAENSPRHVYHTTGTQWEDLDPKSLLKRAQLTRALFKRDLESGTCNRNYIDCLDESDPIVRSKCEIDTIKELVKYCTIESIKKTPLIDAILSDSPILGSKGKLQKQVALACRRDDPGSNENDLYVEMSPLVPVDSVEAVHSSLACPTTTNVASPESVGDKTSASSASRANPERSETSCDRRKKTMTYPKRKFSLLKEKFEPRSQLVYVVTPKSAIAVEESAVPPSAETLRKNVSVILKKSPDGLARHDKENLAPVASSKVNRYNVDVDKPRAAVEKDDKIYENDKFLCSTDFNLKERRHIFLEQVLSPPKLLNWNKRKSFGTVAEKS